MARYFLCALVLGFIFLPISPKLDHDAYLYKWQGYLLTSGINPYSAPPENFANTTVVRQFPYWNDLQFKDFRPIYPPVSQLIFGLDHFLFGFSFLGTKLLFLGFLMGSIWVLAMIAKELKILTQSLWLFVANPVVYYETIGTIHNDITMVFFFLLALLFFIRKKELAAGIFFGLSIGAKFIPLFLLPLFIKRAQNKLLFLTFCGLTILMFYLPFILTTNPLNLFQTLGTYSERWTYTPGLFALTERILEIVGLTNPFLATKFLFWMGLAFLIFYFYRQKTQSFISLTRSCALILGFLLVANSVLFPWYVLWVLVLTPFLNYPWPWVTLGFTSLLIPLGGYGNEGRQLWRELLVWVPFFLSALISLAYGQAKSRHHYSHS